MLSAVVADEGVPRPDPLRGPSETTVGELVHPAIRNVAASAAK